MAKAEGEGPDFDEMKMPGEEDASAGMEPLSDDLFEDFQPLDAAEFGELPPLDEAAPAPAIEAPVTEAAAPTEAPAEEAKVEPGPAEKSSKAPAKGSGRASLLTQSPTYVTWAAAAGVSVLLVILAFIGLLYLATAIFLAALVLVGVGIWVGRETNSVYTVILACALVAVLTAVYCLLLELGRYNMDVKARSAKQHASISQPMKGRVATLVALRRDRV